MAVDIETIGIGVNTKEVKAATKDLDNFGKGADKASREADKLSKESEKLSKSASTVKGSFSALQSVLPILGFTALAAATIRASDSYTKFNAQLKIATSSQQEYNQAQKNVVEIANRAQASIGAIGTTYARLSNALKEIGGTQDQVAQITETLSLALKVNGATAEEASSAMLQLSQAFGKGKLDGDEFRTAMEAAPNVMRALAQSMGVPFGALKDLAGQGQITSDVLLKAFTDQKLLDGLRQQAAETRTISGAWQEVKNSIELAIGKLIEYIGLRDKINEKADLFVQALSPGGLLGGKTEGQQRKAALDEIARLEGRAGSIYSKSYRNKLINDQKRLLNPNMGNQIASGASENYSIAPSFAVTRTEESYKAQKRYEEDLAKKLQKDKEVAQQAIEDKKRKETQFYNYKSRLQDELFNKETELNTAVYKTVGKLEKEEYERKQKYMEILQKQANANYEEAQKKVKELNDEAARIGETLSRSLTDALYRGFESGKSFLENFVDTLKNTFKTLILQPIIRFLVDSSGITKVLAAFGSAFSGNAVAGEGGGVLSSLKNGFSSITDIFKSGNSSIVSSIQDLGAFLSTGTGGLGDVLGGFLGQYSSQIANVLPFAGAAFSLLKGDIGGAIGSGLGAALSLTPLGPVGGIVGSLIGGALGGLFGGSTPKRNWARVDSTFKDGQFAVTNTFAKRDGGSALDPQIQLQRAFSETLGSFLKSFGLNPNISIAGNFSTRPTKSTTASFYPIVDGMLSGGEFQYGKKDGQAFQKYVDSVLGSTLAITIRNSNLSNGIKKFFEDLTSGLTKKEDVLNTINALTALNTALESLPPVFNAVRNAIDTTAYKTSIDALQAQFKATQTFVDLFYSDAEKFNIFQGQLQSQFADLNKTIPTSRDQYRALVESINVVDEATRDQFNGLIALAPAMKQYFDYLEQQANGINEVNQALADGLNQNLFSTYADFVTAQANASAGLTYTGSIGDLSVRRAQGDAELANAVKSLVAQQARTDQILAEIAESTRKTREINERWNGDGLPETRVI